MSDDDLIVRRGKEPALPPPPAQATAASPEPPQPGKPTMNLLQPEQTTVSEALRGRIPLKGGRQWERVSPPKKHRCLLPGTISCLLHRLHEDDVIECDNCQRHYVLRGHNWQHTESRSTERMGVFRTTFRWVNS